MKKILLVLALQPCFLRFSHAETNKIAPKRLYMSPIEPALQPNIKIQYIDYQLIEPIKNKNPKEKRAQAGERVIWKMFVSFLCKFAFSNLLMLAAVWLLYIGIIQPFWPLWALGIFFQIVAAIAFALLLPAVEKQVNFGGLGGNIADYALGALMFKILLLLVELAWLGLHFALPSLWLLASSLLVVWWAMALLRI